MSENLGELANSPAPAAHRHKHSTQCAAFSLATAERRNAFHENCVCSYKSAKDAHYAHSPSAMQSASARKKSAKTKLSDDRMLAARLVLGQPVLLVNSSGSQLFGGRDGNLRSVRFDSELQLNADDSRGFEITLSPFTSPSEGLAVFIRSCDHGKYLSVTSASPFELSWHCGVPEKLQTFFLSAVDISQCQTTLFSPPRTPAPGSTPVENARVHLSSPGPLNSAIKSAAVCRIDFSSDSNLAKSLHLSGSASSSALFSPTDASDVMAEAGIASFSIRTAFGRFISIANDGSTVLASRNTARPRDAFYLSTEAEQAAASSIIGNASISVPMSLDPEESRSAPSSCHRSTQTDDDSAVQSSWHEKLLANCRQALECSSVLQQAAENRDFGQSSDAHEWKSWRAAMAALIQQAPADTDSAEKLLNVTRRKRSSRFHPIEPAREAAEEDPIEARALDGAEPSTLHFSTDDHEPANEPESEHSATIANFFPEFQCDWQAELGEHEGSDEVTLPAPVTAAFALLAVAQNQVHLQALHQNPMQAEVAHVAESFDMLPAFSIACGGNNDSVACITSGHAPSRSINIEQLDSEDASLLPVFARRCSTSDPLHVRFGSDLTPMRASIGNVPDTALAGMFPMLVSCHDASADATSITFPDLHSSALLAAHSVVPVVTECSISPAFVTLASTASDQVKMLRTAADTAMQVGLQPVLSSTDATLHPSLVSAPVSFHVSAHSDQMVLVKPRMSLAVQPDRSETIESRSSSSVTPILYSPIASVAVDKARSDDQDHVTQLLAENCNLKLQVQKLQREALLRTVCSGAAQEVIKYHHASPNASAKRYLRLSDDGIWVRWSWSEHMWQATALRMADIESISSEDQPPLLSNQEWNTSALALRLSFKTADRSYNFLFSEQTECAKWRAVLNMLMQQQGN